MKYSVSLEYSHDFEVDCKGLCDWAKTNLDIDFEQSTDKWIVFTKEGALTPDGTGEYKSDEHKQLKEYYDSLTEAGEAVKLALPSRLQGQARRDWEAAKKAEIATVTDYSTLTEAQKKLWMGLDLTDAEKDGLGA